MASAPGFSPEGSLIHFSSERGTLAWIQKASVPARVTRAEEGSESWPVSTDSSMTTALKGAVTAVRARLSSAISTEVVARSRRASVLALKGARRTRASLMAASGRSLRSCSSSRLAMVWRPASRSISERASSREVLASRRAIA